RGALVTVGIVESTRDEETDVCIDDGGSSRSIVCVALCTSDEAPLSLAPDDQVLVCRPDDGDRGIILGRIGVSHAATPPPLAREISTLATPLSTGPHDIADEVVLEAKQGLTLKCGDGSITIRADG